MGSFGRIALTGIVWLTAITTLIAGFPHFDCRCAGGKVKLFCLGIVAQDSGCCCGGACCSADQGSTCCQKQKRDSSTGVARKSSCCQGSQHLPKGTSCVGAAGCVKSLAQLHDQVPPDGPKVVTKDLVAGMMLPPQFVLADSLTPTSHSHLPPQRYLLSPPTDLITVLQRLVI